MASTGFRLGKHKLGAPAHPDVKISEPSDKDVLTYEGLSGLWKNKPPAVLHKYVNGTTDAMTTSTDWVDLEEMTLTVDADGTYLVLCSVTIFINMNNTAVKGAFIRLAVNDVGVAGTNLYYYGSLTRELAGSEVIIRVMPLSKNDVVKIQWCAEPYSLICSWCAGSPDIFHRSLTLIKLS